MANKVVLNKNLLFLSIFVKILTMRNYLFSVFLFFPTLIFSQNIKITFIDKLDKKPIITTYCTPFNPKESEDKWIPTPCLMSQYEFSGDRLLMSMPWYIQDYKTRTEVIKARTMSGHFYFTYGKFIKEVPYDPDIYFGGYTEETTLSVRAFTNGYNFYSPYRMIMWHEYTRNYRVKHWDDHGVNSETKKTSGERDVYARNKTRQLFGTEEYGIDMGGYGLGKVRSLHDYEVYGGFDFKKCLLQDYTLKVKTPPNPPDWEAQFIRNKYDLTLEWDLEFFKKFEFKNPKFLTFAIHTNAGIELYRKDFTIEDRVELITPMVRAATKNKDDLAKLAILGALAEIDFSETDAAVKPLKGKAQQSIKELTKDIKGGIAESYVVKIIKNLELNCSRFFYGFSIALSLFVL